MKILDCICNKLKFLKSITPADCLVNKVKVGEIINALVKEDSEFLNRKNDRPREDYEEMISSDNWKKFLSQLEAQDELWFYRFPKSYWEKLKGRQGYVILRNGKIIDYVTTWGN